MEENKNAIPADTQEEPIITPADLAEVLPLLKRIRQTEGGAAILSITVAHYIPLIEFALREGKRADDAEAELERIGELERMTVCRNGGGND